MAKRLSLSKSDRFTVLSGIAHDPTHRDIFTSIFLRAQLLILAKEVLEMAVQSSRLSTMVNPGEA